MATVLTIAGSDPSGGAGIQADLQVLASLGVHGAAVITALTIQDTWGVYASHPVPAGVVAQQLARVLADLDVGAIKTGMLVDALTVRTVADALGQLPEIPVVVDPVLRSSSGRELLDANGLDELRHALLPRARLVTPNLSEAEALTGLDVTTPDQMVRAASAIRAMGPAAVLVKGGHLEGPALDILATETGMDELVGERLTTSRGVHGTGCVLSAAAAAGIAQGRDVRDAVRRAKAYVTAGLQCAREVGRGAPVVDHAAAARAVAG